MSTIIAEEELKEARKASLEEIEKITVTLARRAKSPAQRQALAEIEETLRRVEAEWNAKGLIAIAA